MVNNRFVLERIDPDRAGSSDPTTHRPKRRCLPPDPCLPAGLPSTGFLRREANSIAPKTLASQSANLSLSLPGSPRDALFDALNSEFPDPERETDVEPESRPAQHSPPSSLRRASLNWVAQLAKPGSLKSTKVWRTPQAFEVLSAIDKKDIIFLMEVRDKAFEMLLRKTPNGTTPLLYAMQQGKSHQDVAIILIGAFSKFVNRLEDADFSRPKTKELLKALRGNLKLAIDYGLQSAQNDLISSFMQTLIMSEGEKWVHEQISNTGTALRAGNIVQPVQSARSAVQSFATKQLKNLGEGQTIASLEDYVANATGDLLMMGAWSIAATFIDDQEPIPVWYFARDDRVYKAFMERIERHNDRIQIRGSKRLKWQIRVLAEKLEGRTTTWRSKVESLAQSLDRGIAGHDLTVSCCLIALHVFARTRCRPGSSPQPDVGVSSGIY
ncbi:unnamed protein product [Peniophora sp. CBMAI 1063]|nr:unnamed protein product [Peniophora sp. CBMAI 1063]